MFRFTIRDVLWLMVVVAMGAAWWTDRTAAAQARLECESRLRRIADHLYDTHADGLLSNEDAAYIVSRDGSEPILVSKHQ
jgi:hypothetical protein